MTPCVTKCTIEFPKILPREFPMASIQPTPNGQYRAQVCVRKHRRSDTFRTLREAKIWAAATETELRSLPDNELKPGHTLQDALDRFGEEVSPTHRGERWEIIRLGRLAKSLPAKKRIRDVTTTDLAAWRDERLKQVSAGAVLRELGLLSSVFETARREWRWIDTNVVKDIRKPRTPDHRERVITTREIRALVTAMGYRPGRRVETISQAVAVLFLVALRTGMRASELCGLTWDRIYQSHCRLPLTKNGKAREVPLSYKAKRRIEQMRGWDSDLVFAISSGTLDSLFRRYRERAGLSGFTFHDSRHTAATWMSRKVDVLTLCKIFGWRDPKMAMTYYNPKAEDVAKLL